ncbi:MAG: radical SAM protein [Candidatus Moranbacteria bacterium]|nr:radical SAM protein [Candidatus Moranbacteria bacterium]
MKQKNRNSKKSCNALDGFNKEIHTLRFSLTTKCTLDCHYCFVKKDGRVISFDVARKILKIFLCSPGKDKILIIYGGEPLLFLGLLKKIIVFSNKIAIKNNKKLIISNGTNGTLLNQRNLLFLRDNNVKISISLDGKREVHDIARVTKNQVGSFDMVAEKLPLLFKNIKKENLCVLFGILPTSVERTFENFLYITSLGFDSVNIEPIQSPLFKWDSRQFKRFKVEMKKVTEFVYKNIENGNFIFLNSVNREIKDESISHLYKKSLCPFYQNLEVYPDGEMAFSPFLMNSPEKDDFIIGNVNDGFWGKYEKCLYDCGSLGCQNCLNSYNKKSNSEKDVADDVVRLRNVYSIYLARKILKLCDKSGIFQKYQTEAKKRIFE